MFRLRTGCQWKWVADITAVDTQEEGSTLPGLSRSLPAGPSAMPWICGTRRGNPGDDPVEPPTFLATKKRISMDLSTDSPALSKQLAKWTPLATLLARY
jgi:hypothetical protein